MLLRITGKIEDLMAIIGVFGARELSSWLFDVVFIDDSK